MAVQEGQNFLEEKGLVTKNAVCVKGVDVELITIIKNGNPVYYNKGQTERCRNCNGTGKISAIKEIWY